MESLIYPTYQDYTTVDDLPDPVPVSPFYCSWSIPLSFDFSFPELELPSSCQYLVNSSPGLATIPALETFTGSVCQDSLPTLPKLTHFPDTLKVDISLPATTIHGPTPPPSPLPTPVPSPTGLSDQSVTAQCLYDEGQYDDVLSYLETTYFPSSDHSFLQNIYYCSLYELFKISSGKQHLIPSQKYRLRKTNPLPSSISAVKFKSNNQFDDKVKSLLLAVFKRERTPSQETIQMLTENTGLSEKQIRNFFKNKRSRG
ncbi:homeobox protein SIX5-like [Bolinopsis microptera]|uniref:homeobox protein SIX5-like n=1 Tax=Bolinopsis microptera TaxID=2820187 RepID=UPI003078CC0F